jgi:hypothetical protein
VISVDIHFPNGGGVEVGIGLGAAEMTLLNARRELRMIVVNCMFDSWLSLDCKSTFDVCLKIEVYRPQHYFPGQNRRDM